MKERVVIAGGSGFLGQFLAKELVRRGNDVVILSRHAKEPSANGAIRFLEWDGRHVGRWAESLDGARAVINLAGRSVNCRHTPENRKEIIESRVESVRAIGQGLKRCAKPPEVWIQASSLAIYGNPGDQWCDEHTPAANDFSAQVCRQWESAFTQLQTPGTRRVIFRIGFVLGKDGGALKVLANLARWGLGGAAGNGKQYISWLHLRDMNDMFLAALERPDFEGVFNATGPAPVTNREFMRELRQALHRPWSPPAPVWAVRLGAWLMGTEGSLALTGRRCRPKRLIEKGFSFKFSELGPALADLCG